MKTKLFSYSEGDTFIHRLSGGTKCLCFILLTLGAMLSYDIRVVSVIGVFSFVMLCLAEIKFRQIKGLLAYFLVFLAINVVLTYVFAPQEGVSIYGTSHELFTLFGRYNVTQEQLLYQGTKAVKYIAVIPLGMVFLFTTDSTQFASSINAAGVNYKIAYAVSLTLRYFPDVQRDYLTISHAQQARGLELSKKARFRDRFKNVCLIIFPLIMSALDMIEGISNAMDLRGFGKKKKRTWYNKQPFHARDFAALGVCLLMFLGTIAMSAFVNHGRYFNPFVR